MQQSVLKVQQLGVPPAGFESDGPFGGETVQVWEEWMEAVDSIQRPITWEEAETLISCCPIDYMAGVEWTFLHCIESVFKPEVIEQYRTLIEKCNSGLMKEMLLTRLQSYLGHREP